jgi:hypothetical protein
MVTQYKAQRADFEPKLARSCRAWGGLPQQAIFRI